MVLSDYKRQLIACRALLASLKNRTIEMMDNDSIYSIQDTKLWFDELKPQFVQSLEWLQTIDKPQYEVLQIRIRIVIDGCNVMRHFLLSKEYLAWCESAYEAVMIVNDANLIPAIVIENAYALQRASTKEKAIDFLVLHENNFTKNTDPNIGAFYAFLGILYAQTRNIEDAERCFKNSETFFATQIQSAHSTRVAWLHGALGFWYKQKFDFKRARYYLTQAMEQNDRLHTVDRKAIFLSELGIIDYEEGLYQDSYKKHRNAAKILGEVGNAINQIHALLFQAKSAFTLQYVEEANYLVHQAHEIAILHQNKEMIFRAVIYRAVLSFLNLQNDLVIIKKHLNDGLDSKLETIIPYLDIPLFLMFWFVAYEEKDKDSMSNSLSQLRLIHQAYSQNKDYFIKELQSTLSWLLARYKSYPNEQKKLQYLIQSNLKIPT